MNMVTGCSGIDAIAYAAQLLDIELIGQIEIDKFCNKILELRYPGVKRYKDVFNVRGDEFGTVDIFAFGDPCQPHSVAGKQKGTADERYIWPELFRIIKTMRPAWILNENVVGSVSNGVVLNKIIDLESQGYRARAFIIPACAVGAPHERQRVFIVGHTECIGCSRRFGRESNLEFEDRYSELEVMADTKKQLFDRSRSTRERRQGLTDSSITLADTSSTGREEFNTSGQPERQGHNTGCSNAPRGAGPTQSGMGGNANGIPGGLHRPGGQKDSSGIYATFETIFAATLRQILWPAGYGAEQYQWEPSRVATGIKNRVNRLKTLGNAIVPWQIFPFLLAIKLIDLNCREGRRLNKK